jgi:hypothetical protein
MSLHRSARDQLDRATGMKKIGAALTGLIAALTVLLSAAMLGEPAPAELDVTMGSHDLRHQ